MKTLILSLTLLLASCGRNTDAEFLPLLAEFRADMESRGFAGTGPDLGTSIEFGQPSGGDGDGACEHGLLGSKVVINREKWQTKTADMRRLLVYHELGHCVLGLGHEAGGIMDNTPPWSFTDRWTTLVDELMAEAL